jgi:hypothetical protein
MISHGGIYLGSAETAGSGNIMQDGTAKPQPAGLDPAAENLGISPHTHGFIRLGHHGGPLVPVIRPKPVIGIRYKTRICRVGKQWFIEPLGKMKILSSKAQTTSYLKKGNQYDVFTPFHRYSISEQHI